MARIGPELARTFYLLGVPYAFAIRDARGFIDFAVLMLYARWSAERDGADAAISGFKSAHLTEPDVIRMLSLVAAWGRDTFDIEDVRVGDVLGECDLEQRARVAAVCGLDLKPLVDKTSHRVVRARGVFDRIVTAAGLGGLAGSLGRAREAWVGTGDHACP